MINELIDRYPALSVCREQIEKAADIMFTCYKRGGKMLLCGNGGSAADCDHIAGELLKGFLSKRRITDEEAGAISAMYPNEAEYFKSTLQRGIPALSLPSESGVISAYNNDVCPDMVYAQLVFAHKAKGDILIALSTSGNSKNVVNAVKVASAFGLETIGLCGAGECSMDSLCTVSIKAPERETFKVQEYHLAIYHALCAEIEKRAFG